MKAEGSPRRRSLCSYRHKQAYDHPVESMVCPIQRLTYQMLSNSIIPGIQAVTIPSNICRHGTNLPRFFPRISVTKDDPHRIAHSHHIAAHLQSGVISRVALPVTPSMTPNMTALTATNVENHAKGSDSKSKIFMTATNKY